MTVGDTRLFVGNTEHDGGAVGFALQGVEMDAVVCQGALPIGPSFEITAATGSLIRSLDGKPVAEAIGELLQELSQKAHGSEGVGVMAGLTVPIRPAVADPLIQVSSSSTATQLIRSITGYSAPSSVLAVGAAPELLETAGVRLQLHAFSAENARTEFEASAAALARRSASRGGLMVSCLGRGEALYGESGVETRALATALRRPVGVAGMFGCGQIAPVGARTFFHSYATTVAMLRDREEAPARR